MKERPLRTTVIGSYPFPGWLEFVSGNMSEIGPDDVRRTMNAKRYHNIKLFTREPSSSEWRCIYWEVTEFTSE